MAVEHFDPQGLGAPGRGVQRAVSHPYRDAIAGSQAENAADVIAVLMGDHDGGDITGRKPEACQAGDGVTQREAAIDQDARRTRLDQQAVAPAATAEGGEAHHFNCSNSRPRILLAVSEVSAPPSRLSTCTLLASPSAAT